MPAAQALPGCINCWSVIFLERQEEWRRAALYLRQVFAQVLSVHSLVDFLGFQGMKLWWTARQLCPLGDGTGCRVAGQPTNPGLTVMGLQAVGVQGAGSRAGLPPSHTGHSQLLINLTQQQQPAFLLEWPNCCKEGSKSECLGGRRGPGAWICLCCCGAAPLLSALWGKNLRYLALCRRHGTLGS